MKHYLLELYYYLLRKNAPLLIYCNYIVI
uniref:Uncharacterized protein n=1 Tax=Arundo donax TaxID=35708 RepID=A0A0A8ZP05_ARUDO